jgi:hypothetical protein
VSRQSSLHLDTTVEVDSCRGGGSVRVGRLGRIPRRI